MNTNYNFTYSPPGVDKQPETGYIINETRSINIDTNSFYTLKGDKNTNDKEWRLLRQFMVIADMQKDGIIKPNISGDIWPIMTYNHYQTLVNKRQMEWNLNEISPKISTPPIFWKWKRDKKTL